MQTNAVAEKPHDAIVKFDTCRNLRRHRVVLPVIARHLVHVLVSTTLEMLLLLQKKIVIACVSRALCHRNALAAGAPPRTPLGELTALP